MIMTSLSKIRKLLFICLLMVCVTLWIYFATTNSHWMRRHLGYWPISNASQQDYYNSFISFCDPSADGLSDNCGSTEKPTTREPSTIKQIPKLLHQTFARSQVFAAYKPYIESCLRLNPDWKYYLWTDRDIDLLIKLHYPHLAKKFKLFKHKLEKSDAIRRPFFPSLANYSAFVDQENTMQAQIVWNRSFNAMNSGMGATPGHPFFNRSIAELLKVRKFGDPVSSTGPDLLTRTLKAYWEEGQDGGRHPVDLLPDYVMSPVMDAIQNYPGRCKGVPRGKNKQSIITAAKLKLKKNATLFEYEKGCLKLESRKFKLDSDIGPNTIAIHRFRHLGYPQNARQHARRLFNAATQFANRIHFFSNEKDKTTLLNPSPAQFNSRNKTGILKQ
uniref:Sulfotransfer_1 domain-containing protein n=1 Tax=Macrostomum lignano TaxID=282301 RepID=A0A1I8G4C0_9PLAT